MRLSFLRAAMCAAALAVVSTAVHAQTYDTRLVRVRAQAIVHAPASGRLYVTVADDPAYPNSLVAIDPEAGVVEWAVPVGPGPKAVAVSDDGAYVYVGLRGVETALAGLAPNPTRDRATVRFSLAEASDVRLAVFDVHGREVLRLADGPQAAGAHAVTADVGPLAAGVYVVRMDAGAYHASRTLTVVSR